MNLNILTDTSTRVFSIEGEDPYWRDFALKFFTNLVPKQNRAFNLNVVDTPVNSDAIESVVMSISFFPGPHVVVVKNATIGDEKGKKTTRSKKEIIESQKLNTIIDAVGNKILVFYNSTGFSVSNKKKLVTIDAQMSSDHELTKIIRDHFSRAGGIEPNAISLLIKYTNRNMLRISNEVAKLESYCGRNKITTADVLLLVSDSEESKLYEFTEALTTQNKLRTLSLLDKFIASGTAYTVILYVLTNYYRQMLHVSLSKFTNDEFAKLINVKPFIIEKARSAARTYDEHTLRKCLSLLIDAEVNIKSGIMSDSTAVRSAVISLLGVTRQ
ncbi:MAG: DNA polymerase III subunit delta [Christensenellaceae bacterium]|nr:DNA polymerase III subunit delta [Christensenellaceae bacterium]